MYWCLSAYRLEAVRQQAWNTIFVRHSGRWIIAKKHYGAPLRLKPLRNTHRITCILRHAVFTLFIYTACCGAFLGVYSLFGLSSIIAPKRKYNMKLVKNQVKIKREQLLVNSVVVWGLGELMSCWLLCERNYSKFYHAENAESWGLWLCGSAALRDDFAGNVDNEQLAKSN